MAHQENGESSNTALMDVINASNKLDAASHPNNQSVEIAQQGKTQTEESITNVDYKEENDNLVNNNGSLQTADCVPVSLLSAPSEVEEKVKCSDENNGPSEQKASGEPSSLEPGTKEDQSNTSVGAISLTDIKTSLVNDQEAVSSDAENNKTDFNCPINDVNVSILSTHSDNKLNTKDSSVSGNDWQRTVPVVSPPNNVPSEVDVTESNSSNQRVISSYAIQPGELTNQLIEGPSITLPSSEIPNRDSSSSVSCDPVVVGRHKVNDSTPASVLNENGSNSLVPAPGTSSKDISESQPQSSNRITPCSDASATESTTTTNTVSTPTTTDNSIQTSSSASVPAKRVKKTPHDFIFGKVLGEGSYSTVYLAKEVSTQREFAVKVCEKKHLIREHKTHFVMREKEVLMKLDHPFFIRLAYTFQDPERLYYVLTYARNGELLTYLNKLSVFDVPCTRFYSAEVVAALEYLQSLGIIHRDLKPENILLGDDMHIKITDFGTSKIVNGAVEEEKKGKSKRKNSFVGTAEYVSPEVLNGLPANYGTDLWALGCIIYQCLSSSLPFRSGNEYQTFQKILKLEYEFPEGFHEEAKDLVQKLLVLEPTERLGMKLPGGMQELKQHSFFQGIDWENLPTTTPPKLLPYLPASANNPEFWGGQEQRTGFDDQRLAEIITGQSADRSQSPELEPVSVRGKNEMQESEWREKIDKQRQENHFHQFVDNNLILRQGFVDKRKGFFARKRMLLLTEGPHLYYVDAHNKVLKGEIPWSKELRSEAKNFKIFFVHTPNRTYYLESRHPDAHHWVKRIQEVWDKYYGDKTS